MTTREDSGDHHLLDLASEPWRYPGPAARGHVLLTSRADQPCPLRLRTDGGPDLYTWHVEPEGEGAWPAAGSGDGKSLDLACRQPVVGIGSNSCPDVLWSKFRRHEVSTLVPLLVGTLDGHAIAASAHVSRPGFVPVAAVPEAGRTTPVTVAWLDDAQLRCLDETEPNYCRTAVDTQAHPLHVPEGRLGLSEVQVYSTRRGVVPEVPDALLNRQLDLWRHLLAQDDELCKLLDAGAQDSDAALRPMLLRLGRESELRDAATDLLQRLADRGPRGTFVQVGTFGSPPRGSGAVGREGPAL